MIEFEQPTVDFTDSKVINHEEFLNRIKKTLYYGSSAVKCTKISRPLADYAADIFSESHRGHSLSRLNFVTVGNLTVTPCSLILAMIYLDRLNVIDPAYARRITPSELFIVSMMVSTKFYCGYDEDIYLSAWAESGNMSVDHMKELELEFLDAIDWKVYVSNQEFFEKLKSVEKVLAKRQGINRGWLTYTELINFLPTMTLAKQILNYSTVIALSYTASVMTIAGAFFLASNVNVPGNMFFRGATQQSPSATEVMTCNDANNPPMSEHNCSALPKSDDLTGEFSMVHSAECTLQKALDATRLLNRAYFNDNAKFQYQHYKAEFIQLPTINTLVLADDYVASASWKKFRFIYPSSTGGNTDEDHKELKVSSLDREQSRTDESESRNCTSETLSIHDSKLQRETNENVLQTATRIYTSYKQTFEMFSSFLKFL